MAIGVAPDAPARRRTVAATAPPPRRCGTDGCTNPAGFSANQPPSTRCANRGSVAAVADLGYRDPQQRRQLDDLGGGVRADVHSSISGSSSVRCSVRYVPRARRSSPYQSSRPIIVQKSSHCWPVVVCKATYPSRLGCRFGSCDDRTGRNGTPAISYQVTGKRGWLNISASSAATSTRSPMPCAPRAAQRGQRADGRVRARGPVARSTPAQQRRAVRRAALHVPPAQGLAGEVGRRSVTPWTVEAERAHRRDDHPGMVHVQRFGSEARVVGDRRTRRPHDDVGIGDQTLRASSTSRSDDRRCDHAVLRRREEPEEARRRRPRRWARCSPIRPASDRPWGPRSSRPRHPRRRAAWCSRRRPTRSRDRRPSCRPAATRRSRSER